MTNYEVLYIDKFESSIHAHGVIEEMAKLFHLTPLAQHRLCSGSPIVIKHHVNLETAEYYRRAVAATGATCWIQAESDQGTHIERRSENRRQLRCRRATRRDSAIQPDRRAIPDRRH